MHYRYFTLCTSLSPSITNGRQGSSKTPRNAKMIPHSIHPGALEPIRSTVLFEEKLFPVCKFALFATRAFRRVWAIEVGNVLVADITEPGGEPEMLAYTRQCSSSRINKDIPVNLAFIFKQAQCDRMHRRISPSLIEKPPCAIEMVEVFLIDLAAPEVQVCDFKVTPKVTRRVPVRFPIVFRSLHAVR